MATAAAAAAVTSTSLAATTAINSRRLLKATATQCPRLPPRFSSSRVSTSAKPFPGFALREFERCICVWSIHYSNVAIFCTQGCQQSFVVKPYYLKRKKRKALEKMEKTHAQVREARAAAEKAQQLLLNVANRKRSRHLETGGLVITKAVYGNRKALKNKGKSGETKDELASQIIDVAVPLNFLVNDSGRLKRMAVMVTEMDGIKE